MTDDEFDERYGALRAATDLKTVINFLMGDGHLNGFQFGETPEGAGKYWWRKHLRAALASAAQPETERERLRAEQSTAVMPLIGPLLDAWESMDNDTRGLVLEQSPELAKYLKAINRAMLAAAPKAAPAVQHGGATWAAARALSDRVAEMCNVDKEDHWMHHSDDVLSDAELVISTYLAAQAQEMPAAVAPQNPPMPETWHVDVHVHGEKILSIGYDWLSGKGDLTESEEQAVVGMAQHLLSFVGYGLPQSGFDPDADEQAPEAQGDALDQGVREDLSIGKAINRAARDLPEGWEIRIDLERHAGVVFLIDPDGNETMSEGGELFSDQINAAIEAAHGIKPKEQA